METLRNRFFVQGILLGALCGLAAGSIIAFQLGGRRLNSLRRLMDKAVGVSVPDRKYILQ